MEYKYNTNQSYNYNTEGHLGQTNLSEEGLLGVLGGSLTNMLSGDTDYQRILEQQGLQNAFEANQAEIARKWQEYMSNTSYQRTVKDMKEAGLNPYLAYGSSPSSTPSTSSPSGTGVQRQNSGSVLNALVGSLVGGAFDIAKQGMANSAKTALMANTNAYDMAKQEQYQNYQMNLANLNSRNAIHRDDLWRDFYKKRNAPKNKNPFLNSNDRSYTDKELLDLMDSLMDDR